MKIELLKQPYNYDTNMESDASGLLCLDESLTQQHQKDDADINVILKRFGITGQMPQGLRMPSYGDFTGVQSYQEALNMVMEADSEFMRLPAEMRARFDNDAGKLLDFLADENNKAEAEKLGLVNTKQTSGTAQATAEPVPVVTAPSAPKETP